MFGCRKKGKTNSLKGDKMSGSILETNSNRVIAKENWREELCGRWIPDCDADMVTPVEVMFVKGEWLSFEVCRILGISHPRYPSHAC